MGLRWWEYLRALLPDMLLAGIIWKSRRSVNALAARPRDRLFCSYGPYLPNSSLHHYFHALPADFLRLHRQEVAKSGKLCLKHRIEVPGAGLVELSRDSMEKKVNWANLNYARQIRQLIDSGYRPIDWHINFETGSRWDPTTYFRDIRESPRTLARMEHLIAIACAFFLSRDNPSGFRDPSTYAGEFRNQVLDFIAANPPRFGVNWSCNMDVGRRVANWLVAFDLFYAQGVRFGVDFEREFARSVYEHARHIVHNLGLPGVEEVPRYLGAVTGLLFASAFLPCGRETDVWLALAIQELNQKIPSTSPDIFAVETATYATALVLGLPHQKRRALQHYNYRLHRLQPPLKSALTYYYQKGAPPLPFSSHYLTWLERAAEAIVQNGGGVEEAGGAHFLKFRPPSGFPDYRPLISAVGGLFAREDFREFAGNGPEREIIHNLAQKNTISSGCI